MEVRVIRAPLRVSFAGGGTEIEPYLSQYGGAVLNAAIKYYAQAIYPSSEVVPSEMEKVISDFFQCKLVKLTNGAPQMSGLGGSAACFVAGIKAIYPELSKDEIANLAFHLERNVMGVAGGKQDQFASAYGGLLHIEFTAEDTFVHRLDIPDGFARLFVLVHMGKRDMSGADVIKDQIQRYNVQGFHEQKRIVDEMLIAVEKSDFLTFGKLLDEAWRIKEGLSPLISNDKIKEFYQSALTWGAIGGKITGAGGGGYMLLMEHPEEYGRLRANLSDREIPYLDVYFDTKGVCVIEN